MSVSEYRELVLVHGLWYGAWSMSPMRRYFSRLGRRVRSFSYPSRTHENAHNAAALADFIARGGADHVDLVGHSLGGLLILDMLNQGLACPPGRLVLLGSPLHGSGVARVLRSWPGGRWLLGAAGPRLAEQQEITEFPRETGVIAGNQPLGLGRISGALEPPHDGTVAVEETLAEALADHLVLPVTHSGMLLARAVAIQADHFLTTGTFCRNPEAASGS